MSETWLDLPQYEGHYQVSDLGNVRSLDRIVVSRWGSPMRRKGVILKSSTHYSGYLTVGLCKGGKQANKLVHCLVMSAFVGDCPFGLETCHGDGDKKNNRLLNLRYDTKQANAADKVAHGTNNAGDTNARARFTAEEVARIYERCKGGEAQNLIASELGVAPAVVNHIATGRTWASVTGVVHHARRVSVTPEIVRSIDRLQSEGKTLEEIAVTLSISKATAFRHSKGKSKITQGTLCN